MGQTTSSEPSEPTTTNNVHMLQSVQTAIRNMSSAQFQLFKRTLKRLWKRWKRKHDRVPVSQLPSIEPQPNKKKYLIHVFLTLALISAHYVYGRLYGPPKSINTNIKEKQTMPPVLSIYEEPEVKDNGPCQSDPSMVMKQKQQLLKSLKVLTNGSDNDLKYVSHVQIYLNNACKLKNIKDFEIESPDDFKTLRDNIMSDLKGIIEDQKINEETTDIKSSEICKILKDTIMSDLNKIIGNREINEKTIYSIIYDINSSEVIYKMDILYGMYNESFKKEKLFIRPFIFYLNNIDNNIDNKRPLKSLIIDQIYDNLIKKEKKLPDIKNIDDNKSPKELENEIIKILKDIINNQDVNDNNIYIVLNKILENEDLIRKIQQYKE